MKFKHLLLTSLASISLSCALAQNRAPSCWLKYNDHFAGDILVTSLKADTPSPLYTYHCALQWNPGQEAGGYCGFQEHPDGKNFIFSIWDPMSTSDTITAEYAMPTTIVENFGGEGTGLKSWNFNIGWATGNWYSFVTRAWNGNDNNTFFGYWIFDHSNTKWHHMVTMDFPVPDVKYNTSTGAFIEDWLGNGNEMRRIEHKNGWKRRASNSNWFPFTEANFERVSPDPGAANYIDNYDGGVVNNNYFMQTGGTTTPVTNPSLARLNTSQVQTHPDYTAGAIVGHQTNIGANTIAFDWLVDSTKAPQFSYHLEVFENADFTGNPSYASAVVKPHLRQHTFDIASLLNGKEYSYKFYIKDIFDQQSNLATGRFIANTSRTSIGSIEDGSFQIFPNPFQESFIVKFKDNSIDYQVTIYDIAGKQVQQIQANKAESVTVSAFKTAAKGIYFVNISNPKGEYFTYKVLKN